MKSFCRRHLGLLLPALLLALPACQRPEETPRPAELLPQDKMVQLIADLQVLEARVENSRLSSDSSRALYLAGQKDIFWRHEATDSTFQRSFRYYSIHGKDLDGIYEIVIDTLSRREQRLIPPLAPAK